MYAIELALWRQAADTIIEEGKGITTREYNKLERLTTHIIEKGGGLTQQLTTNFFVFGNTRTTKE